MLYFDTCVLLAVLIPEVHSALGLKVRTKALNPAQAETVLQGFEFSLAQAFAAWKLNF